MVPGIRTFEFLAFIVQRIGWLFYVAAAFGLIYGSAAIFIVAPLFLIVMVIAYFFMHFINATYPLIYNFCLYRHFEKDKKKYLVRRAPHEMKMDGRFRMLIFQISVYAFCGAIIIVVTVLPICYMIWYHDFIGEIMFLSVFFFFCGLLLSYYCFLAYYAAFFVRKYKVESAIV